MISYIASGLPLLLSLVCVSESQPTELINPQLGLQNRLSSPHHSAQDSDGSMSPVTN
jgi:hypothetical protein